MPHVHVIIVCLNHDPTSNHRKIMFRIDAFFHPQFGEWAGQLGDGRAVMLGEYINRYTDMMQNLSVYENIYDYIYINTDLLTCT